MDFPTMNRPFDCDFAPVTKVMDAFDPQAGGMEDGIDLYTSYVYCCMRDIVPCIKWYIYIYVVNNV